MIKLELFDKNDFSRLISWVNTEELLIQFAVPIFKFPLTNKQLQNYLEDKNREAFKVIELKNSSCIGHAEIYFTENFNVKLCRILIGDSKFIGKGFCNKIIRKLLDVAFLRTEVKSVELNVFEWNLPAIKCYKSVGFKIEKKKSEISEVNGKLSEIVNMRISKKVWNK